MADRKLTRKYAMLILNMKYSLGKTYDEIKEALAKKRIIISRYALFTLCTGKTYNDVYEEYWRQRNK